MLGATAKENGFCLGCFVFYSCCFILLGWLFFKCLFGLVVCCCCVLQCFLSVCLLFGLVFVLFLFDYCVFWRLVGVFVVDVLPVYFHGFFS